VLEGFLPEDGVRQPVRGIDETVRYRRPAMALAAPPDAPLTRRLGTLAVGLVLVATGVALTITAEIGVAPYDVLTTGLVELTGLPIGIAAMLLPLGFVALGWLLGRSPGSGTVLAVLLIGPILGLVLDALPAYESMAPRVALFAVGFVLVAAGITAVVIAEIGPGPAELVMLALHERGHPLAPVRTGIELTSVAVGFAMGGQVGIGTLVFASLIGLTLRWMLTTAGYVARPAAEASDCASPGA
jgi:uncharacterized membrane protein YczE